jgi:hypothetical protein
MKRRSWKAMAVVLILVTTAGCRGGSSAPPTVSSDDVLATAHAIAQMTRNAPTDTPTPVPETATPTVPPDTPTPSATATLNFPAVTASYPVSVRSGPGEEYPILDLFLEGQAGQIIGRYDLTPIGTWYLITRIGQGINGWVWSGATVVTGDISTVPVLEAPPTPEPD